MTLRIKVLPLYHINADKNFTTMKTKEKFLKAELIKAGIDKFDHCEYLREFKNGKVIFTLITHAHARINRSSEIVCPRAVFAI